MSLIFELRCCARTAACACLLLWMIPELTACSSGTFQSPTVVVSSSPDSIMQGSAVSQTAQNSPVLIPTFNPAIHDYVVRCAAAPSVQLKVTAPGNIQFGWVDVSGASSPPASYPTGFQRTIPIAPGQRIQFSFSNQAENYSIRCLPADFPMLSVSFAPQPLPLYQGQVQKGPLPGAQWYVFAPTVAIPPAVTPAVSYVIITDAHGTPVWWKSEPDGDAFDAKILGANEIAWTTESGGLSLGDYVIRNFDGGIANVISSELDGHDLQPTSTGTYLVIKHDFRMCPPDCADLSPWGAGAQMGVLDEEIDELDQNSNVLWTWKTRDHISLAETGGAHWLPAVGYDIIHMNSVEPDGPDAVIFSARHLSAIYRIIKSTGAVDWKIGGVHRPESLAIVGDVRPTALGPGGQPLSGQHDARRLPDGTVSVHDNGTIAHRPPSVVRFQIDTAARTAQVVQEFDDPRVPTSACCGSARALPNGHWLVSWGAQPFMTEFDANGTAIFTVQYNLNGVFSYRAVPVGEGVVSADVLRAGMDAMAQGL